MSDSSAAALRPGKKIWNGTAEGFRKARIPEALRQLWEREKALACVCLKQSVKKDLLSIYERARKESGGDDGCRPRSFSGVAIYELRRARGNRCPSDQKDAG